MSGRPGRRRWPRLALAAILVLAPWVSFLAADRLWPVPLPGAAGYARLVLAADGQPLRAFADPQGVWRYPVPVPAVSPLYRRFLLAYEDRWFLAHPGVNPLALARAAGQALRHGRIVSGGSTLTMQVARILDPHPRTVAGKLRQIFRALQLEWHLDKEGILALYLNHAPFGGTVAGVAAACHTYLGKGPKQLTVAEAALLAALPQAPSRLRPDRHPGAAQAARDKVLARLAAQGLLADQERRAAMAERVVAAAFPQPQAAPLLAERLAARARPEAPVRSAIDAALQGDLEALVADTVGRLPPGVSAAVLVVDNDTLLARAYLGSSHYGSRQRAGFVDMVQAVRSPGSTLKPFLYGLALDEGLIHAESLLADAPRLFGPYRPANFGDTFSGPVSVREALQRSLNLPAVQVLEAYGPDRFADRLEEAGLTLTFPAGGGPDLPMILGGVGVRLAELVGAYTALAMDGLAGKVRLAAGEPLARRRLLSPGAAFIIRQILLESPAPDRLAGERWRPGPVRLAWKTGTSYGFRDAWAVGVAPRHTIGVWLGRPDGTPVLGQYGLASAAPLLFAIARRLPDEGALFPPQPASVQTRTICWPLGQEAAAGQEELCPVRRPALILAGQIPPTLGLPAGMSDLEPSPLSILTSETTGLRVGADCGHGPRRPWQIALWPRPLEPWLAANQRRQALVPAWDPACAGQARPEPIRITSLGDGQIIRPAGRAAPQPELSLQSLGGRGRLFWLIDGQLRFETAAGEPPPRSCLAPGRHQITVIDETGASDRVDIFVQEPGQPS
ncbi:MAG: penicillin-binding protein 1C [Thermodesulfobacteriota bacterium]